MVGGVFGRARTFDGLSSRATHRPTFDGPSSRATHRRTFDGLSSRATHRRYLVHDTNKIDSIISIIDSNIPESSIRDCTRLGRYSENICRPILAKLSRTCEVSSILSQRHKLKGSKFSVKPELTKEERKDDQLLMKRRWDLMQSGMRKEAIKFRGNSMYVNNLRFGSVVNGAFIEHNSSRVDDYLTASSHHCESTQSTDPITPQSITPKQQI